MWYGSLKSFQKKFDDLAGRDAFRGTNMAECVAWQEKAREKLRSLLGLDLFVPVDFEPHKLEVQVLPGNIVREKWVITTEQDVLMPLYLLIPADSDKTTPVCICPAGHQGGGKESVAGNKDIPCIRRQIAFFHYDYALKLAEAGYVAVAPDPRGFGERRDETRQSDEEADILGSTCLNLAHMAEPLGFTVIGSLVWDLMRLVDFLAAQGRWNVGAMSMVGFSGGGMQTLYTAALDPRIRLAFVSGYFYGFKDSLLELNGNCSCNYVPGLWRSFDCADIAAMIAPRPLVIQSCSEDHLNGKRGMVNVMEQYVRLQSIYALFGAGGNLLHDVIPGDHHFGDGHMLDDIRTVQKNAVHTS